jgi:hypothetical protein
MKEDTARVQTQLTEFVDAVLIRMQKEADRRADAMLERLVQKSHGEAR